MTYPFKYSTVEHPTLELGVGQQWGPMTARRVRASAGRHVSDPAPEHRVILYLTDEVHTECGCDGQTQRRFVGAGDLDLLPAGAEGWWEDSATVDMMAVRLAPALLAETAEAMELSGAVTLRPHLGVRDPKLEHVMRAILAELDCPQPTGRIYADSLAVALAGRLLHGFSAKPTVRPATLSRPHLRRLTDFVEENLGNDLSLATLAAVTGMSVASLTASFRRTTGQTVHAYVMQRRVERAKTLLLAREFTIAEVAAETGFSHQSHLAHWMKRLLGVTPSEIRRL